MKCAHFRLWFVGAVWRAAVPAAFSATETVIYGNFEVTYYGNGDTLKSSYYSNYARAQDWTEEVQSSGGRSVNYRNSVITTELTERVNVVVVSENASGEFAEVFTRTDSGVFHGVKVYEENETYVPGKEYFSETGEDENGDLELSILKIYNPPTYSSGSSVVHVEYEDKAETEDSLMSYLIANGKIRRELNADEFDLMRVMGWTIAVPDPSAFGFIGGNACFCARRRSPPPGSLEIKFMQKKAFPLQRFFALAGTLLSARKTPYAFSSFFCGPET